MAKRRMFSRTITESSSFLMMPSSSQNLYFHLGMAADDDGFCEHFTIMRMVDAKPDDLKILHAKGFVQVFDDKVLVITNWKENNYIQSDRYSPSKYLQIYKEELKQLASGIPNVYKVDTQVRLGKDRKGKDTTILSDPKVAEVIQLFKDINPSYKNWFRNTTQRKAVSLLLEAHGFEKVSKAIALLPKTNTMPYITTITTPHALESKWAVWESQIKKKMAEKETKGKQIISST